MSDATSRLNAALEGRYRIERQLGEGGMATVYLARDERHKRNVALKVLKPELAAVVGAERFLAEIQTTANLQHPHILPLFDSGEADGFLFYVMPFVEGVSLQDRLDREHQLPVDEAVRIATNVSEALDYAHRHGVIHRDIKPANILLQDGKPVVADFGIALAVGAAGGGRLTETGLSLGTPHYMSPEQATGDVHVGPATDIYALGCVLYEMLVGDPPYTGSTPQAVLGKIVTGDADPVTKYRRSVPPNVDAAIRKALEKVPADRFVAAGDFGRALSDPGFRHRADPSSPPQEKRSRVLAWLAPSGWAVAGLVALWALRPTPMPPTPVTREVLSTDAWAPQSGRALGEGAALAPDGSSMVLPFQGQLGLKLRNSTDIVPILGTEGARNPTYAPDGQRIAYAVAQDVFVAPLLGGPRTRVGATAEVTDAARVGLSWLDDGTILYEQGAPSPFAIVQVGEGGGEPIATFEGFGALAWIDGLPGARGALVVALGGALSVLDLRDGSSAMLFDGVRRAWYAPTGHLVYVRNDGTLLAVPFDLGTLEPLGAPIPILEGVRTAQNTTGVLLGRDGTLLYEEGSATGAPSGNQLVILRTDGTSELLPITPQAPLRGMTWSPDGASIAFSSAGQLYTYDAADRTEPRQVTFDGTNDNPVYSPDGTRLLFSSVGEGTNGLDLFVRDLESDASPRMLLSLDGDQIPTQWPADTLALFDNRLQGQWELWTTDPSSRDEPKASPYLAARGDSLAMGRLSRDGRLVAYAALNAGQGDVYVRPFPEAGQGTIASFRNVVGWAAWSSREATLYFGSATDFRLVAARFRMDPVPAVVRIDTLTSLTQAGVPTDFGSGALHPDGDRLLLGVQVANAGDARAGRLVMVQNFFEELKRLAPD